MAEARSKAGAQPAAKGQEAAATPGADVPEAQAVVLAGNDALTTEDPRVDAILRDLALAADAIRGLAGRVEALEGLAGRVDALEGGIAQVGEQTRQGLASMMEQLTARLQALAPVPVAQEDGPTGDQLAAMAAEVGWLRGCVRLLSQAIGVRLPPSPDRSAVVDAREADAALVVHAGGEGGTVGPGVVFGSG